MSQTNIQLNKIANAKDGENSYFLSQGSGLYKNSPEKPDMLPSLDSNMFKDDVPVNDQEFKNGPSRGKDAL